MKTKILSKAEAVEVLKALRALASIKARTAIQLHNPLRTVAVSEKFSGVTLSEYGARPCLEGYPNLDEFAAAYDLESAAQANPTVLGLPTYRGPK